MMLVHPTKEHSKNHDGNGMVHLKIALGRIEQNHH